MGRVLNYLKSTLGHYKDFVNGNPTIKNSGIIAVGSGAKLLGGWGIDFASIGETHVSLPVSPFGDVPVSSDLWFATNLGTDILGTSMIAYGAKKLGYETGYSAMEKELSKERYGFINGKTPHQEYITFLENLEPEKSPNFKPFGATNIAAYVSAQAVISTSYILNKMDLFGAHGFTWNVAFLVNLIATTGLFVYFARSGYEKGRLERLVKEKEEISEISNGDSTNIETAVPNVGTTSSLSAILK